MTSRHWVRAGDVSRWAREIVAKRLLIAAAVAAVGHLLVGTGLVPDGISEQAEQWTVSVIDAIALVGAIFWTRAGTTPADPKLDPVSANGKPLVEAPVGEHRADSDGHVRKVARADLHTQLHDRPEA